MLLATTPGVSLNTTTPQPVYMVPTGKDLLLLEVPFCKPDHPFGEGNGNELRVFEGVNGQQIASVPIGEEASHSWHYAVARVTNETDFAPRLIPGGKEVLVAPNKPYGSENTCTVSIIGILFDQ